MFKNQLKKIAAAILQQKVRSAAVCLLGVSICIIIFSYSSGPAKSGQLVTGAPFNSGLTCAKSGCHSGGNFGGAISTQLIDTLTNKAVTAYVPGKGYNLKIILSKTTGSPKYGFQTTVATAANANVNTWGAAPKSTHNTSKSGHNYIEQSKILKSGTVSIPWNGPVKGTGSVIFYTSGNIVNGDGGTSGDQVVNNSLTVTEAPAPIAIVPNNETVKQLPVSKNAYSLKLYNEHGGLYVMFHNSYRQQKVQLTYTDLQGNPLMTGITIANEGDNIWPLNSSKLKGFVIVNVLTEDGIRTSLKVIINKGM
ncbi:MAG TPA: hypothetical protein PLA68_07970 [Panacibacter sp.]|nr:hypothetical protein [Panacibacter sp.]